ncbi:hypothetical protein CBR_g12282 [Chara braunii]|uniref:CCHC-type domain-containing protein n=1 Tax=Chara braunii TaxID=69332 RepID=A0A388KRN2_CHABU|nr:hypothetical protein CBR_g12282 [Chara braunii]|eukprot:GBG72714.1 hypothetical protein CBR_g12282 [Chara braunii]
MANQAHLGQLPATFYAGAIPAVNTPANQQGMVSCYLCGKLGHYARNCWSAGNGRPPAQQFQQQQQPIQKDEIIEMKAYFRKKIQKQKMEEERREKEIEERRRREEEDRKEADRIREAEAREARLEARLVRLMSQHTNSVSIAASPVVVKKKYPRSKARMLREITSYLDESEDESEEVREEASRMVDAIEKRKGKRRIVEGEGRISTVCASATKASPIVVEDIPDEIRTPPARKGKNDNEASCGEVLDFVIELHRKLSAKKAPDLRKMCNEEGIEWTKKGEAVGELVVRGKVGKSVIMIRGERKKLKKCKQMLERGTTFAMVIKITSSAIEHRRNILRDMVRQPWRIRDMYRKKSSELLALYRTASTFGRKITRNHLKVRIAKIVCVVHGIEVRSVKIPFSPSINTREVSEVTARAIGQIITDTHLRVYVTKRVQVVFWKCAIVGQLIHNQRICTSAEEVRCMCGRMEWPWERGHVKVRLDDISGVPSFLKNSRNVTCGDVASIPVLRDCILAALKTWSRGKRIKIGDEDLKKYIVHERMKDIRAMKGAEVKAWSRRFGNLVAVPIDRNTGATLLICPVLYLHACKMTFNFSPSFAPVQKSEMAILREIKQNYARKGLEKIATWGTGGEIGQAYVLPKDKDLERWRPISPATKDPARLAGSRIGRAVTFMLFGTMKTEHFDMRAMDDLRRRSQEIQREFREVVDGMYARSYDIKDMFARLAHESVIDEVRWIIEIHRRRKFVGVRVSQRGKICMMAKNARRSEGFVLLDFTLIMEAVTYELENTYVKCAGEILKQDFGIPMGRNSSPALACVVCARSETMFVESMGRDRDLIRGIRMIDDIAVFVAFETGDQVSKDKAAGIFDLFERCLKLVRKDD